MNSSTIVAGGIIVGGIVLVGLGIAKAVLLLKINKRLKQMDKTQYLGNMPVPNYQRPVEPTHEAQMLRYSQPLNEPQIIVGNTQQMPQVQSKPNKQDFAARVKEMNEARARNRIAKQLADLEAEKQRLMQQQ